MTTLGKRLVRDHPGVDVFWDTIYRSVFLTQLHQFSSTAFEPTPDMRARCDIAIIEFVNATRAEARSWIHAFIADFKDIQHTPKCNPAPIVTLLRGILHDIDGTESLDCLKLFFDMRTMYINSNACFLCEFDEHMKNILFHGKLDLNTTMSDIWNSTALFSKDAIYRFFHSNNLDYIQERSLNSCFALVWWKWNMKFVVTSNYQELQRIQNSDDANEASLGHSFVEMIREFAGPLEPMYPKRRRLYSMRKRCTQEQVDFISTSLGNGHHPSSVSNALLATSLHESSCANHMNSGKEETYETVPVMLQIDIREVRDQPHFVCVDHLINPYGMGCSNTEFEVLVLPGLQLIFEQITHELDYNTIDSYRSGVYLWAKLIEKSQTSLAKCILLNNGISVQQYSEMSISAAITMQVVSALNSRVAEPTFY
jgi:hypothetical protein